LGFLIIGGGQVSRAEEFTINNIQIAEMPFVFMESIFVPHEPVEQNIFLPSFDRFPVGSGNWGIESTCGNWQFTSASPRRATTDDTLSAPWPMVTSGV
jgi:hypothetical protein